MLSAEKGEFLLYVSLFLLLLNQLEKVRPDAVGNRPTYIANPVWFSNRKRSFKKQKKTKKTNKNIFYPGTLVPRTPETRAKKGGFYLFFLFLFVFD